MHGQKQLKTKIASPWIVRNQYFDPAFEYAFPFYQWDIADNEWAVTRFQKQVSRFLKRFYWNRVIATCDTDLIHAHFAPVACEIMYAARKRKIPLVVSFYGNDYEKLPYVFPKFRALYKDLFEIGAAFCCEGAHGASILVSMGCPAHKIQVIRLGLEPDFTSHALPPKQSKTLKLLQAATFIEKKGIEYTVQAFALALKTCPNMHLTLIGEKGDFALTQRVMDYIHTHQLDDNIKVLDFIEHHRFQAFLNQFHVFIHPSTYAADRDCEGGGPVVLLDAQKSGLPIIATTHCDIPDYVAHNKSGILVAERDIEALSHAIERFYEMDNTEYQDFSENAKIHVQNHFDIHQSRTALRQLYQNVLFPCAS